jgi:site-specific DNA-methyltransferase (adenine-specific)
MQNINNKSIDMILCDLPYGQTARNKWDTVIPFQPLWEQYTRIIKDDGAIVLFANGMFTADLMQSNRKMWKYNLVWDKALPSGFLNAKKMPMRSHEDICVFYKKPPTYNPQMVEGKECHSRGNAVGKSQEDFSRNTNYGELDAVETKGNLKYPKSILTFQKPHPSTTIHPTQKPVECLEWLVNTYTNENELVLDNCIGSGSTAVACINTKRNFIGFENDTTYCDMANKRIQGIVSKLQ